MNEEPQKKRLHRIAHLLTSKEQFFTRSEVDKLMREDRRNLITQVKHHLTSSLREFDLLEEEVETWDTWNAEGTGHADTSDAGMLPDQGAHGGRETSGPVLVPPEVREGLQEARGRDGSREQVQVDGGADRRKGPQSKSLKKGQRVLAPCDMAHSRWEEGTIDSLFLEGANVLFLGHTSPPLRSFVIYSRIIPFPEDQAR